MMKHNFDVPINRRQTNSLKWNVADHELPMWVADMDFQTAPEIQKAIVARAEHGIYGYTEVPDEWYQAYIVWWKNRHHYVMEKSWLIFCTGVVPAISSMVRKLTTPGEKILIQTPVYNIFFNSIQNNCCQILESPLKYHAGEYSIDFDDLEQKLADPQTTCMILCNPHNPIGKVWSREELLKIGALCYKHHVTVIADEIHCDLTHKDCDYTPFASVSEQCKQNSITCIAPTKAFNLAGLQTAAVVVPNDHLRHKVWRALNTDEIAEPNVFAIDAAIAAFTQGGAWLDGLRVYVQENKKLVTEYVTSEIPFIKLTSSQATYLLWLDCSTLLGFSPEITHFIREKNGLYLSDGKQFGSNGDHFIRMNIACPRTVLEEGLKRLKEGVTAYQAYAINLC